MKAICNDLAAEYDVLDALVSGLPEGDWDRETPFDGWLIRDQITHLAYFDRAACLSATDEKAFNRDVEKMVEGFTTYDALYRKINTSGAALTPTELIDWWRKERGQLLEAFAALNPKDRLPWYGPQMSARSSATARLMETWAHGQDIYDALKRTRSPTRRLKHIAHLGVTTFKWSFANRQLEVPGESVRVVLQSPDSEPWVWGPEETDSRIQGLAEDFCLVVTQRRHFRDTALEVTGEAAEKWMENAQVFAGPPESAPPPGLRKW